MTWTWTKLSYTHKRFCSMKWGVLVRRGHRINHASLTSLLCLHLCWLTDTQHWRSAHSLWHPQPLIERHAAYNYIWAHGRIAVWWEKCHIEMHRSGDGRFENRSEFTVNVGMVFLVSTCLFSQPSLCSVPLFPICPLHTVCLLFGAVVSSYSYYVVP